MILWLVPIVLEFNDVIPVNPLLQASGESIVKYARGLVAVVELPNRTLSKHSHVVCYVTLTSVVAFAL